MKIIVVIDGVSSSGRTSLTKAFRRSDFGAAFQSLHIDEFTQQLPVTMWKRCSVSDSGWAEIGIAYNNYLVSLAQQHDKLIADAFYKLPPARKHLFSVFNRNALFFVQLYCNLEELERRENQRGNRRIGLARSQFQSVYAFSDYDLRIDSTDKPVAACVNELTTALSDKYYAHA